MNLIQRSIEIIETEQNENGAFPACSAFKNYRYSWFRDSSFIIYSLCRWKRFDSAKNGLLWNAETIIRHKDKISLLRNKMESGEIPELSDFLPARYHLDGSIVDDDWPAFQIDGYGAWLWAAAEYIRLSGDDAVINEIKPAVNLTMEYLNLVWMFPNYDCWEENGNAVHPSSLACIYGGCSGIAEFVNPEDFRLLGAKVKSFLSRALENQSVVPKYIGSSIADASSLWLCLPFAVLDIRDSLIQRTVEYIEKRMFKSGGVKRYPGDTYYGGGSWIILSAWLGWYYAKAGKKEKARGILRWIEGQAGGEGELPEQVLEYLYDAGEAENWRNRWGEPADPLLWSHAMYLVLTVELQDFSEMFFGIRKTGTDKKII